MTLNDILNMGFYSDFGSDEDGNETESIEYVYNQLDNTVSTAYGASKFVIFLNEEQVIKVPFNGEYFYDEEDNLKFDYFCNEDYCMIEAAVYNDAVAAGVERFFAGTKYAGSTFIDKTPIYISERVAHTFDSVYIDEDSCSKDSFTKAENMKSLLPKTFLAIAIDFYGLEAVEKLNVFIEAEGISDLHYGNLGFRSNGEPVLIDYSGFDA